MSEHPAFLSADEWIRVQRTLRLSARESQILSHIIAGLQDKRIAVRCGISIDTVRTHVRRVYAKVGANSRSRLLVRVFEVYVEMRRNDSG